MQKIILASQSPRRKQLLEWAEVPFQVIVPSSDEVYPPHLNIEDIPVHIAKQKIEAVKELINDPSRIILAADTIVVLDDEIIGKPVDTDDGINILQKLSGKTHRVITGVVIHHAEGEVAFADITEVQFHDLTQKQIEYYVEHYKPFDKAGAYAIQEWMGVIGIKSIRGDFYNVMGLPISRVLKELEKLAK